ncbi:vesicle transport through interaction with t-SNAREs homolog 1A [Anopheles bellator]|uniref:vesicle transport through interaction with t-SNAREs homolog 1A n=1 Tax=Anopheles bellator TaxID=139047 RepID=UPI00264A035F|nr:vesicle transport through interaction with t-SNAREs homolog 1A [Anopheles bellator]
MELVQDYEQQYAVQTAEITAQIGRIAASSGAERNKLISDIDRQLEESQELLEQIGLEIRDIPQTSRAAYTSRLNCYQAEWKRLQQEFNNAKIVRSKAGYDSSVDEFDEIGIQEDQKRRLLDNTERLERTSNYLNDAYRVSIETEQVGAQVLADLSQQRETIQRSRGRLREADADLSRSSRILNSMIMRAMRDKFILVVVVVAIFLVLVLSIYFSIS